MTLPSALHSDKNSLSWNSPVTDVPGIGPKRAKRLHVLGIQNVGDLLSHFPRDYIDRRTITPLADLEEGQTVTSLATIVKAKAMRFRRNASLCVATIRDDSGEANVTWFGRGFLARQLTPGRIILLTGVVGTYKGLCIKNPNHQLYESFDEATADSGRLEPIYPLTEGLTQRVLRNWIRAALDNTHAPPSLLPPELEEAEGFPPISQALHGIHYPEAPEEANCAKRRLIYEKSLTLQLAILQSRAKSKTTKKSKIHTVDGPLLNAFRKNLPYTLTPAQTRCVDDILNDLVAQFPMERLLQGDVGSGKTCVALFAATAVLDGQYQVAIMAPTEVLAEQHANTFHSVLSPLGVQVALLTGSTPNAKSLRKHISNGTVHVVIGTHALFQEATEFKNLGLVIIDEQHRFGVGQRERLVQKGGSPDVLHLTATPLPRSLALTLYGRMDLSLIDELPPGRQPVKTRLIPEHKVTDLWEFVVEQAQQGLQTYIITPFIEESEEKKGPSVIQQFEELSTGPLASISTGLLHGQLSGDKKRAVLNNFREGTIQALFSTTVVEVGVDVPQATLMVILDAYRFGLSQLHQLRGRVGRGTDASYCFLIGNPPTEEGIERLNIFCSTTNGFELADADLDLRGPGEMSGVRQSGFGESWLLELLRDPQHIEHTRRIAQSILTQDPELKQQKHQALNLAAQQLSELFL